MKEDINESELLKKYPVDWIDAKRINAESDKDLSNSWCIIDSSRIGINYAIKLNNKIIVYTGRLYGKDISEYTFKEFNNWRNEIKQLNGT